MAKAKRLRVGVIGAGIGEYHLAGYESHPQAEVVALCDLDETKLAASAAAHGIPHTFTDYKEMLGLAELDAVSVCVPNFLHAPLVLAALAAGKHVLCEKPLSVDAKTGRKMVDAAKAAKKLFMIQFNNRYRPEATALKSAVDSGALGEVYFARCGWIRRNGIPGWGGWFTQKEYAGGGPLIDLAVHMFDLTWWLMGRPQPVSCLGATYSKFGPKMEALGPWGAPNVKGKFDVEDMGVGMVRFANGATVHLEASWASRIEREWCYSTLCGDVAGATLERQWDRDGDDSTAVDKFKIFKQAHGAPVDEDVKVAPDPAMGRLSAVRHFVDSVLNNTPLISPASDGLVMMKILDALYKSAQTGKAVNIS
ncbi:MAG TPA: Gfo/Idh/MocA family oxidoreductase [Armatimonadota bacterium]|jgi:predicted dehydrogenase